MYHTIAINDIMHNRWYLNEKKNLDTTTYSVSAMLDHENAIHFTTKEDGEKWLGDNNETIIDILENGLGIAISYIGNIEIIKIEDDVIPPLNKTIRRLNKKLKYVICCTDAYGQRWFLRKSDTDSIGYVLSGVCDINNAILFESPLSAKMLLKKDYNRIVKAVGPWMNSVSIIGLIISVDEIDFNEPIKFNQEG